MSDLPAWLQQLHARAVSNDPGFQQHLRRPQRLGPTPQELRQMPTRPVMPAPRRIEPQRYRAPEIGETPPPFPFVQIPTDAPVHPPGRDSPDAFPETEAGGFDWAVSGVRAPRGPSRLLPSMLARREPMDIEPWRQPVDGVVTENSLAPGMASNTTRRRELEPPSAPQDYAAQENADWNAAVARARAQNVGPDPTMLRNAARRELEQMRLRQELEQRLPRLMAYQDFNRNR